MAQLAQLDEEIMALERYMLYIVILYWTLGKIKKPTQEAMAISISRLVVICTVFCMSL